MQQLGFIDSRKRLAVRKPSPGEHMGSLQHIIVCIALKRLSLFLFERGDGGYLPIKRPIRGSGQASRLRNAKKINVGLHAKPSPEEKVAHCLRRLVIFA